MYKSIIGNIKSITRYNFITIQSTISMTDTHIKTSFIRHLPVKYLSFIQKLNRLTGVPLDFTTREQIYNPINDHKTVLIRLMFF